uniref:Negative elongation factor A n=1 Tax=Aceria tosichella TaxID=561515 RepID=A0A6G1S752_9ACAR
MVARDFDTALWLHNKLGTSNDQWSGKTIVSQLSRDKLRNIRDCFIDLQPQVKLKLLLAIIHIAKRNVEDWRAELEDILDIAVLDDSGQRWVSTIAELLRYYPRDFQINLNIVENTSVFNDLVTELKNAFDEIDIDCAMLPLECIYLNKNAMTALFGPQPLPEKHFTLIRKPKSAAIRAELLQRSSDALSGKSLTTTPSIPIRMRGVSDTPLRGISAKSPFASVMKANSAAKGSGPIKSQPKLRDGGVKLLEIDQQPSTSRKRKKEFCSG